MERKNGTLIEKFSLPKDTLREGRTEDDMLILVTGGTFTFRTGDSALYTIREGEAFCLASGTQFSIQTPVEEATMLIFFLQTEREIIEQFFPVKEAMAREPEPPLFYSIIMNHRLLALADMVGLVIKGKAASSHEYLDVKLLEVCYTLQAGYNKKEALAFFRPVMAYEHSFEDFVMQNYRKVNTARELMALSPHSPSAFKKRFRETFGEAPYQWMMRQKAIRILYLINSSRMSFTDISIRTGFNSLPQFTNFCRKNLGDTPRAIRRRKTKG